MQLFIRETTRRYRPATVEDVARYALADSVARAPGRTMSSPEDTRQFLSAALQMQRSECFAVLFLDNRHRVIEFRPMFFGTIDNATVYPREIARVALSLNAAAAILAHNHPSGIAEPSDADRLITRRIRDALELIDVRLLDHFVIGNGTAVSLASRGML